MRSFYDYYSHGFMITSTIITVMIITSEVFTLNACLAMIVNTQQRCLFKGSFICNKIIVAGCFSSEI